MTDLTVVENREWATLDHFGRATNFDLYHVKSVVSIENDRIINIIILISFRPKKKKPN